jgi:hypothetical protein
VHGAHFCDASYVHASEQLSSVTNFLHHSNNTEFSRVSRIHSCVYDICVYMFSVCSQGLEWYMGYVSMPTSVLSLFLVYYWSTFCTNRTLLAQFLRIYCVFFTFMFVFSLWAVICLFKGFDGADFSATDDSGNLYRTYIVSAVFMLIYNAALVAAVLDIWAYSDDVMRGGDIKEPNGPPPVADLSEVTLQDGCLFCVALPLGACLQVRNHKPYRMKWSKVAYYSKYVDACRVLT